MTATTDPTLDAETQRLIAAYRHAIEQVERSRHPTVVGLMRADRDAAELALNRHLTGRAQRASA